uniref:Candidate secreted effector n=1 Tax=Meloidogyne incognita TaxID=6306 RepID=A0A914NCF5_MELIC
MSEILNKFGSEIEKIEETKIEKIEEKENDPLVSTLPVSPEIIGKKEKNIPPVPKLSVSPEMIGKKESLQNSKRGRGVGTPVPSPRGPQKKGKTIINITPSKSTHKKNGDQDVKSPSVSKKKKKVHFALPSETKS